MAEGGRCLHALQHQINAALVHCIYIETVDKSQRQTVESDAKLPLLQDSARDF